MRRTEAARLYQMAEHTEDASRWDSIREWVHEDYDRQCEVEAMHDNVVSLWRWKIEHDAGRVFVFGNGMPQAEQEVRRMEVENRRLMELLHQAAEAAKKAARK